MLVPSRIGLCFRIGNCRVAGMETGRSISIEEASAALAEVRRSQSLVAWRGYPSWYWLGTGACLGGMANAMVLPGGWDLAVAAVIGVVLIVMTHAASRVRGVCEGWFHGARPFADRILLAGPAAFVMVAGAFAAKFAAWAAVVAGVLIFVLFAGTGLAMSARR